MIAAAFALLLSIQVGAQEPRLQEAEVGYTTLHTDRITVHHAPEDSARAARMLAVLTRQPPLPALPDSLPDDVEVYLAPDGQAFDSLTGGMVPEWGAGVALPGTRRIVLPAFGGANTRGWSEARVLRHEWAHLGLHQYLEGLRIPRWFNEGYAEWASGGWNAEEGWQLRLALAGGGAPPLDSLTLDWPRDRGSAELAYMLAGTAVEYLMQGSGERGLSVFLQRWRDEGSFETALRSVYGVTGAQFEEDWREYVKDRYGWLFVLSHSVVFWLFLALALVAMAWIRRRRNREAMARLRASDPSGDPAWWEASGPHWSADAEEPAEGRRGHNDR